MQTTEAEHAAKQLCEQLNQGHKIKKQSSNKKVSTHQDAFLPILCGLSSARDSNTVYYWVIKCTFLKKVYSDIHIYRTDKFKYGEGRLIFNSCHYSLLSQVTPISLNPKIQEEKQFLMPLQIQTVGIRGNVNAGEELQTYSVEVKRYHQVKMPVRDSRLK